MANETKTPLHRWEESTLLVNSEGCLVAPTEANKALSRVWDILEEAIKHSTKCNKEIDSSVSLYTFFEDWCKRAVLRGETTQQEVELILGMSHMWGAYVGDRVEQQSLKYFFLEDCIEGGGHQYRLSVMHG